MKNIMMKKIRYIIKKIYKNIRIFLDVRLESSFSENIRKTQEIFVSRDLNVSF